MNLEQMQLPKQPAGQARGRNVRGCGAGAACGAGHTGGTGTPGGTLTPGGTGHTRGGTKARRRVAGSASREFPNHNRRRLQAGRETRQDNKTYGGGNQTVL
jgi:hypothetical protein